VSVANFELLSPYTDDDAAWLDGEGCPHPVVRPGNRMPTTADLRWALEEGDEFAFDDPTGDDKELYGTDKRGQGFAVSGFDWDRPGSAPDDYIKVRGSEVLLPALIRLAGRCGQLFLYPDSGAPPIVIEAGLDAEAVAQVYAEACEMEDGLAYFYERMYGPDGLAAE
jgi:hypothetical protein